MTNRWAPAFTIVELIITVAVLAILAVVTVVGYNGISKSASTRAAQSDLKNIDAEMQRAFTKTGSYPSTLPTTITNSRGVTLNLVSSGEAPFYDNVSAVQNGVLLSQICQNLVDEGVGRGINQGGTDTAYITGCGNWNYGSMQVTGWNSRIWNTPVTAEQLLNYANNFTTNDNWNKIQETVVRNFFNQLVSRQTQQGGSFPVNSFWDYWATPANGGVMMQPLASNPQTKPFYCAEARLDNRQDVIWHVSENSKLQPGAC